MLLSQVNFYVALRRATGYKIKEDASLLRHYARFATRRGDKHVRSRTAIEWAGLCGKDPRRRDRLQVVIKFARWAHAENWRHEVPPEHVFEKRRDPFTPFMFTPAQVRQLVGEAFLLPAAPGERAHRGQRPMRASAYGTLFALLAATGLRISEALALRFFDVTSEGLRIRQTKFRKSRIVPLHPSTMSGLERYLGRRKRIGTTDDHLFLSCRLKPLRHWDVNRIFHQITDQIGLRRGSGRRRPRIHDLRHFFAVRVLERSPLGRAAIDRHMLAMSTYMGHVSVASTYCYLRTTPHLLENISDACEAFTREVTTP